MAVATTKNVEIREAVNRLKETMFTFGFNQEGDEVMIEEYLLHLRETETRRAKYLFNSPQACYRKTMVKQMMDLGCGQNMSCESVFLAIYLLDRFMDMNSIPRKMFPTVALVCLVVSAKLMETDRSLSYKRFKGFLRMHGPFDNRNQMLVAVEKYMLKQFNFDILLPTEVTFLSVYLFYSVDGMTAYEGEERNNNLESTPNANYPENPFPEAAMHPSASMSGREKVNAIHNAAFCALEVIALDGEVSNYPPSLLAAAVLMAARREHGLNFWTPNLSRITSYELSVVYDCLHRYVEVNAKGMEWNEPFDPPNFLEVKIQPGKEILDQIVDNIGKKIEKNLKIEK